VGTGVEEAEGDVRSAAGQLERDGPPIMRAQPE
jgi:hypothetical protein